MKAAVCREFGKPLVIEELAVAPPRADEIKVKIAACGICQSDIHFLDGSWDVTLPAVFGHEAAGIVEEVGPGVTGLAPGDHVVVTLIRACGDCHYCAKDEPIMCETSFPLDREGPLHGPDGAPILQGLRTGAFAEYAVVHASQAVVVPKDLPFEAASMLACGVITGWGAVFNTAEVRPGSSVVVIGTGGVGLNSVQGAKLAGADPVVAIDLVDEKLEAAKRFGATHGVNPATDDAVSYVRSLTSGRGAEYVLVTAGAKASFELGFELLSRSGAMVVVGMPASGVTAELDPGDLAADNKRILGSKMGESRPLEDVPKLVELYRDGRLKLDELITGRYGLEEINQAIADYKSGGTLRNVIVF